LAQSDADAGAPALELVLARIAASLPPRLAGQAVLARIGAVKASASGASVRALGGELSRAGLLTQANEIFRALARDEQTLPLGLSGLAEVAAGRELWSLALSFWSRLIADHPTCAGAQAFWGRGRALDGLRRSAEARAALDDLVHVFGSEPHVRRFHAEAAMRAGRWLEALELWREIGKRSAPAALVPTIEGGMAESLAQLRRLDEAESICRAMLAREATNVRALRILMRALTFQRRQGEALDAFAASPYGDSSIPALLRSRLEALMKWHRFDEARAVFEEHLNLSAGVESLQILFDLNPSLNEGWKRTSAWIAMERLLARLPRGEEPQEAAAMAALRARIALALRDRQTFVACALAATETEDVAFQGLSLRTAALAISEQRRPDLSRTKIFGIGLSKTATTTLAKCLNSLGIVALHWSNPFTAELFCEDDLDLFDGFTDFNVGVNFEKYYYLYPNSKFIFTTRELEDWSNSVTGHWVYNYCVTGLEEIAADLRAGKEFNYGRKYYELSWGTYFREKDLTVAYRAYEQRVRRFFADKPKPRFLEFNLFAGDEWSKLADFLGCDAPDLPFPNLNQRPKIAPKE
jgi:tetratricopeptide (TPR) repeat protein